MKNKFVLTEDESKRILSLHKEKIDKERTNLIENVGSKKILTEAIWDRGTSWGIWQDPPSFHEGQDNVAYVIDEDEDDDYVD